MSSPESAAEEMCPGGLVSTNVSIRFPASWSCLLRPRDVSSIDSASQIQVQSHTKLPLDGGFLLLQCSTVPTSFQNCLHGGSCQNTQDTLKHGGTLPRLFHSDTPDTCPLSIFMDPEVWSAGVWVCLASPFHLLKHLHSLAHVSRFFLCFHPCT